MRMAITRDISPAFERCELTHLERQPIDVALARAQHHQYEAALRELGCQVHRLPAEPDLPDSVFVEDVALVLDELALITRPGAESRRPETASVARALSPYRELVQLQAPATLDGGDVLRLGQAIYVGLSSRSNAAAIEQTRAALGRHGYTVTGVRVDGCLHLKSAVTQVGPELLLVNRARVDPQLFGAMRLVDVDDSEPDAANGLLVGGAVIFPASYPRTAERLEAQGVRVRPVDVSEVIKAEGAVTCCSLVFEV